MKKWIQKSHIKKGALHRQLDIPQGHKIPKYLLHEIARTPIGKHAKGAGTVTHLMKKRAVLALNLENRKHRR